MSSRPIVTRADLKEYNRRERVQYNRDLRLRLLSEDPHCHWCRCEVFEYPQVLNVPIPKDRATIDHLYERTKPELRYRLYDNDENKVLACSNCNVERSRLTNEEMQERKELMKNKRKGQSTYSYLMKGGE